MLINPSLIFSRYSLNHNSIVFFRAQVKEKSLKLVIPTHLLRKTSLKSTIDISYIIKQFFPGSFNLTNKKINTFHVSASIKEITKVPHSVII